MNPWLKYVAIAAGSFVVLALVMPKASAGVPARSRGRSAIVKLGKKVDPYIPGFSGFASAVAYHESRWSNRSHNDSDSEVTKSCQGWERLKDTRYKDNPYGADAWCIGSGGWFGFLPSTGLFARGFENEDPALIFDPAASVAMFADFVRRVTRHWPKFPPEHRNWLTIRRFMAGNTVGFDWREQKVLRSDKDGVPRATKIRLNFPKALSKAGLPEDFMYRTVTINDLPSARKLWDRLRKVKL